MDFEEEISNFFHEMFRLTSLTSILTFFSIKNINLNIHKIYENVAKSQEYLNFIENNKNSDPKDIVKKFIKNIIYKLLDDKISVYVNDIELNNIFADNNLDKKQKIKLFIMKIIKKNDFVVNSAGSKEFIIEFTNFMTDVLIQITENKNINSISDIYFVIIDYFADTLIDLFYQDINVLNCNENRDINSVTNQFIKLIGNFNDDIDYKSINRKRKRNNTNNFNDPNKKNKK